ncbi:hypothetical protein [Dentiradicibacter hellwigii]|uniref:Uncharacterized protein n=1 Tax=Dentiradicibacter hellwigii TaxID=3149053 RepID=A0ABV4UHB6_9RHOO
MSRLSQFVQGGAGVPVGCQILSYDVPSDDYLRCGDLVPYSSEYEESVRRAPYLRVYGNDTTSVNAGVGNRAVTYHKVGTMFVAVVAGDRSYYSTDLRQWTAHPGAQSVPADLRRAGVNAVMDKIAVPMGSGIGVIGPGGGALNMVTITGGGMPYRAITASPVYWVAAASLRGNAGELVYCGSADPSQTWERGSNTSVGMERCNAIAYGNAGFVFGGASNSAGAGKIAYSSAPHSAVWDITRRIPWAAANAQVLDVVSTFSHYLLLTSQGVYRSANLTQFDRIVTPFSLVDPGAVRLTADNTGTIVATVNTGREHFVTLSADHGETWGTLQVYTGRTGVSATAGVGTITRAGNRWIANFSGTVGGLVDLGTTLGGTPDFVGAQSSPGPGWCVRVK